MRAFAVAVVAGILASASGCDNGGASHARGATTTTAISTADAKRQLRHLFHAYNAALHRGDFGASCNYLAPETIAKLRESLRRLEGSAPAGCRASMTRLYRGLNPVAMRRLRRGTRTARIERILVTGDSAVIEWMPGGNRIPNTQSARRVGGEWKLVDVSN
jgi:hypothetical protein